MFSFFWQRQGVVRQLFVAVMLVALAIASAHAEEGAWSFEAHPSPNFDEMSDDERFFIRLNSENFPESMGRCMTYILATYEVYLRRYPEYQKSGKAMVNFRRWKEHIAEKKQYLRMDCLYFYPMLRLHAYAVEPFVRRDFYYCGAYSREAITPLEYEAEILLEEVIFYANSDHWLTIAPIIRAHEEGKIIELNPDVEYYFRKLMLPVPKEYEKYTDVSHLIPQLSPERIAFLEDAIAKRDYHAVATSTKPCKPRPPGRPRF